MSENNTYEVYGHRGARGYFPENTIDGFTGAVKMGVHWLEMDVVISKDKKVVVSHEPWMNPKLCTMPDGKPVTNRKFNLYKMNYDEIKKFDCGTRTDKNFPEQKSIPSYPIGTHASKPLLSEVIDATSPLTPLLSAGRRSPSDLADKESGAEGGVRYCIEIKSFKIMEGKYQPPAEEFAELVYEVIKEKKIEARVMLISFDRRILRLFRELDPKIKTGFLFINFFSVKTNIRRLGFIPYAYYPYYKLATKKMVDKAHKMGMKVIAWTVNDEKRMRQLIKKGADGIITDYPDRAIRSYNGISGA